MHDIQKAVVAYIPAWHSGYEKFFQKYPYNLYIFSEQFLETIPRLDRDIRAISPAKMATIIRSQEICSTVEVLTNASLKILQNKTLILPDELVSREFATQYFPDAEPQFVSVFLRWDRVISTAEQAVPENRKISKKAADIAFMHKAQKEAGKSPDWWRQVGAFVITSDNTHLVAHNSPMPSHDYSINTFGDPRSDFDAGEHIELSKCIHAEAKLIAQAARDGMSLNDATLYVTTYPCPPCAKLVATAGIKKVYYRDGYSLLDAEDIFNAYAIEITLVKMSSQDVSV